MMENLPIQFVFPWALTLLIPAALLTWRNFAKGRGRLHFAVLAAGVLALAEPVLVRFRTAPETLVLCDLDRGANVDDAAAAHPGARIRRFRGDTAAELAAAGALLPDGGGVIHLYGGLDAPDGSTARTARQLARRGIPVYPHILPRPRPETPQLRTVSHPPVAGVGETVTLNVEVAAPKERQIELAVTDASGAVLARKSVGVPRGDSTLALPLPMKKPGEFTGTLWLSDTPAARLPLRVDPPLRALVFASGESEAARIAELFAPAVAAERWNGTQKPEKYPLIIFGTDVVTRTPPELLTRVAATVNLGAGAFFFAGKRPPFPTHRVPPEFARLLPVAYRTTALERTPDAALVIIIDTSGSMSGSRLDLAREVARLATDKLRDRDQCGIIEFHGRRRWAAPLQSAADRMELHRALNRLTAGGGTLILPALREAYYALRNTEARLKHVLIITDGGVEHGDFETLIREMARRDITVSTVMAGAGDSAFLAALARWGNGRFYRAASRFAVPELTFRQSGREQLPPWRKGVFPITRVAGSALTGQLPQDLTVFGALECDAAAGSEVLLRAGGLPFLARKPHGAGSAAVLNAAPLGRRNETLFNDPRVRGLLAALGRSLADPARRQRFDFRNLSRRRDLHIMIDGAEMPEELPVALLAPDGTERRFTLRPEADGACHFRLADAPVGICRLTVAGESIRVEVRPEPFRWSPEDEHTAAARIEQRSRRLPVPDAPTKVLSLQPLFGGAFIVLLLAQLLLRRLPRRAALLLAAACLLPAALPAETYEALLRRGVLTRDPAALAEAERRAATPDDRKFARLLRVEAARQRGKAAELPSDPAQLAADPELLELVANDLEDRGQNAAALDLLERFAAPDRPEVARQMLRLAQKCDRTDALRSRVRRLAEREPEQILWLDTALRLELLAGRRRECAEHFRRALARGATPEFVSAAAETATALRLYDEAAAALDKLGSMPGADLWRTRFRKVALYRTRGDAARATELLRGYAALPNVPAAVRLGIADRAEQLGDSATALAICRAENSCEARLRTAALLEALGRDAEAERAWEQAMLAADNEMRALQAMDRMIDVARRRKKLEALLRRLADTPGRARQVRLQRAYCRALAAAGRRDEALSEVEKLPDPFRAKLDHLLEFKRWHDAVALLETRIAAAPLDRRGPWLRQLAVIAIESGDAKLAERATNELLRNSGDRLTDAGFAAEVCMRLDSPQRAVELYDECLKLAPDRHELHLLRANALRAAGRKEVAIRGFRTGLAEDAPPEKFGVMVDGLLNLEAPREALREALAATLKRIERAPEQLFYYRIAEDLADELADPTLRRKLLLMQLAAAPARRELLLRELFEEARLRDDRPEAEHFARLLVGWNKVYPPELHQALGRTLAQVPGGFAAAERSARSADDHAGGYTNLKAFIDTCLDLGRPADADRICRELVSLAPDDETLLDRYALTLELAGEFQKAGELRERQLRIHTALVPRHNGKASPPSLEERRLAGAVAAYHLLRPEPPLPRPDRHTPGAVLWALARRKLAGLRTLPRPGGIPRRRSGDTPPVTASDIAAMLARRNDADGAKQLEEIFDAAPPMRRQALFARLPWELVADPAPPVEAELNRILDRVAPSEYAPVKAFRSPVAARFKRRCADRARKLRPDSLNALMLSAAARWTEKPRLSRLLAGEAYDRFLQTKTPTLPLLRRLRDLNFIYAAAPGEADEVGARALQQALDALQTDRQLLGDTPQRTLLAAVLLEAAEQNDRAAETLFAAWRNGYRDLATFKFMEELTVTTGRYQEFLALLQAHPPKDQMTEVLYRRRLLQLLRDSGRVGEALMQLPALPAVLQRRERLQILAVSRGTGYAWELRRFLLEEARNPRFTGVFFRDFGLGGALGAAERHRQLALPRIAAPELKETLEYLLIGTEVGDPAFAALLKLRQTAGGARATHFAPAVYATPGGTVLRAALGEPLDAAEVKTLETLCRTPKVPAETAEALLVALPPDSRRRSAEALARRMLATPLWERDLPVLERVLARLDDAGRTRLAAVAATAEVTGGDRDRSRFRLLAALKRSGVLVATPRLAAAPDSEWALAAGAAPLQQRLEEFLAVAGRSPEWRDVLPLLDDRERRELPAAAVAAVERAVRRRLLGRAEAVETFSRLALADPAERGRWLALAARYDTAPGAASLWRLDALTGAEKSRCLEELRQAKRLPPSRDPNQGNDCPQPQP